MHDQTASATGKCAVPLYLRWGPGCVLLSLHAAHCLGNLFIAQGAPKRALLAFAVWSLAGPVILLSIIAAILATASALTRPLRRRTGADEKRQLRTDLLLFWPVLLLPVLLFHVPMQGQAYIEGSGVQLLCGLTAIGYCTALALGAPRAWPGAPVAWAALGDGRDIDVRLAARLRSSSRVLRATAAGSGLVILTLLPLLVVPALGERWPFDGSANQRWAVVGSVVLAVALAPVTAYQLGLWSYAAKWAAALGIVVLITTGPVLQGLGTALRDLVPMLAQRAGPEQWVLAAIGIALVALFIAAFVAMATMVADGFRASPADEAVARGRLPAVTSFWRVAARAMALPSYVSSLKSACRRVVGWHLLAAWLLAGSVIAGFWSLQYPAQAFAEELRKAWQNCVQAAACEPIEERSPKVGELPPDVARATTAKALASVAQDVAMIWLVATLAAWMGRKALRRGQRVAQSVYQTIVDSDSRPPILFLRAFPNDSMLIAAHKRGLLGRLAGIGEPGKSINEILREVLSPYGPLVSIGDPKQPIPPLGAAQRFVPEGTDWEKVVELLADASSFVVLAVGNSPGVTWEFKYMIENRLLPKTLLLLPEGPVSTEATELIRGIRPAGGTLPAGRASEQALVIGHVFDSEGLRIDVLADDRSADAYACAASAAVLRHVQASSAGT